MISDIAFRAMAQDHTDNESTLVQVMTWCCQATSYMAEQQVNSSRPRDACMRQ